MSTGRDRTSEFKSTVQSISLRSASQPASSNPAKKASQRTEFARTAGQIANDIHSTTLKLEKLAQLAKRKTLFDDRPVEISELTFIIKQDIASLNQQIAKLQSLSAQAGQKGKKGKLDEHNNNVVLMLQSRLASTSVGFKDVLEIRTQNMKATRDRTSQFAYNQAQGPASVLRSRKPSPSSTFDNNTDSPLFASAAPKNAGGLLAPSASSRTATPQPLLQPASGQTIYDEKGKSRSYETDDYLSLDMGPTSQQDYEQMQLLERPQEDSYYQSRSTAISQIESTIQELGGIFSQLATMVEMQADQVQRIDQDTSDIANNVEGAQRELLKYYASISSNRWLMLKVMGVIIIFFLLFILVSP
ncbi:t-SNARE [Atractiella rhizophila]|nr:t-SNARE [Atractiella rhizophila]